MNHRLNHRIFLGHLHLRLHCAAEGLQSNHPGILMIVDEWSPLECAKFCSSLVGWFESDKVPYTSLQYLTTVTTFEEFSLTMTSLSECQAGWETCGWQEPKLEIGGWGWPHDATCQMNGHEWSRVNCGWVKSMILSNTFLLGWPATYHGGHQLLVLGSKSLSHAHLNSMYSSSPHFKILKYWIPTHQWHT